MGCLFVFLCLGSWEILVLLLVCNDVWDWCVWRLVEIWWIGWRGGRGRFDVGVMIVMFVVIDDVVFKVLFCWLNKFINLWDIFYLLEEDFVIEFVVWFIRFELWYDKNEDDDEVGMEFFLVVRMFGVDGVVLSVIVVIIVSLIWRMSLGIVFSIVGFGLSRVVVFGCWVLLLMYIWVYRIVILLWVIVLMSVLK